MTFAGRLGRAASGGRPAHLEGGAPDPGGAGREGPAGAPAREAGFGLLEVLIASSVLMVVFVPTTSLVGTLLGQSVGAGQHIAALSLAEQWVETLGNQTPPSVASGPDVGVPISKATDVILGGTSFTVTAEYQWARAQNTGGTGAPPAPDLCTDPSVPQLLNLQVTVSWDTTQSLVDTANIDYPPSGVQTNGFIAVQITGNSSATDIWNSSWATRVSEIPVVFTPIGGSALSPIYPDQYGCVFEELAPGSYTVSAGTPLNDTTPFVTNAFGNAGPIPNPTTASVTVVEDSVAQTTFAYDEGTLVVASYPTTTSVEDGVVCPGAGQFACIATGEGGSGASIISTNTSAATWTADTLPAGVATRVTSTACAGTVQCVAVGSGPSSGSTTSAMALSASPNGSGGTWTSDSPLPTTTPAITSLEGATCAGTVAGSATCFAVGTSSSTASESIFSAAITASTPTWETDTVELPANTTISDLSPLVCMSATACYATAMATTTTGGTPTSVPVIVSSNGDASPTWQTDTITLPQGTTVSGLSGVTCDGSTNCYAAGTIATGSTLTPTVVSTAGGASPTWVADTLPSTPAVTELSELVCPSAASCYATGTTGSGSTLTPTVVSTAGGASPTWVADTLPSTPAVTELSELVCPSAASCYATGTTGSGSTLTPTVVSTAGGASPTWVADTLPSTPAVTELSELVCPSAASCYATGTTGSGSTLTPTVVSTAGGASPTWVADTLNGPQETTSLQFFFGLSCSTGTSPVCAAVGATANSAVITELTGPSTWTDETPVAALTGLFVTGIPLSVQSADLLPTSPWLASPSEAGTNATLLPPLFPFGIGYTVAAANPTPAPATAVCPEFADAASVLATGIPGGQQTVTVPLGFLPIAVTSSATGLPLVGATVTATADTPGCADTTSYNLQTTGPDGLSRTELPNGTYTLVVTSAGVSVTSTVTLSPDTLVDIAAGVTTTITLPDTLPVAVS